MKRFQRLSLWVLFALLPSVAAAEHRVDELVFVVHPSNQLDAIPLDTLRRIYLRKNYRFPGKLVPDPVDIDDHHQLFEPMLRRVHEISMERWKREWSQRVFKGQGMPPRQFGTFEEVLAHVAEEPAAIGYIPMDKVDKYVKAIRVEGLAQPETPLQTSEASGKQH